MKILNRPSEIVYPEGDGKPMAESDLHRDEMVRLIQTLKAFFAHQSDVYISGNLLLYYEEGNPRASVAPDVFVVRGIPKHRRVIYKLWEEGAAPCFVIEVASRSTTREDRVRKRDLYARLGVQEYILYDPRFPGLETRYPPLQGYRLGFAGYELVAMEADGSLLSGELELRLVLERGLLQFYDGRSGAKLLSPAERAELEAERANAEADRADAEASRANAEADRANAEAEARRAVEARLAELEALLRDRTQPS